MKTLYLDIFSGISGDMFIGAMLDLGVDLHQLEHELAKLHLDGYHLHAARQQKAQIEGIKFDVHLARGHDPKHHHEDEHAREHTHGDGPENAHSHSHDHGHSHPEHTDEHAHEHTHSDGTKHSHAHDHEHHHHDEAAEHHHGKHEHGRNFSEIKKLIGDSVLSDWVKEKSIAVFQRIAVAEGKIHGMPPEQVHFHEVGAVDSIVDIVGACIVVEMLGKPRILASNVTEGTGWINCAHGRFPIPAPATLAILGARGIPLTQCDEPHELITPTGAALLAEFVESFGPMQNLTATKIGFGLGTRDNKTRPNVVRAILSEGSGGTNDWETDTVALLETNLDDINSEILGHFSEKALASGALDVFHTPIQMKKNRPGILLSVLCAVSDADKFSEMILRETTAFGVRRSTLERRKLRREFQTINMTVGEVSLKIGKLNGTIVQASPEFESCKKLAHAQNVTLKEIYAAVAKATGR